MDKGDLLMELVEYKKIIGNAIEAEVEAYEFYKAVSEQTADSYLKQLFGEFAEEELKHKELLSGYLAEDAPKQLVFDGAIDYKIAETVDKPKLSLDMKPAEAVALAMKNEEEAMDMYLGLAAVSVGSEQKAIFESLAEMEKGHKAKLEDVYTNMAYAEVW